MTPQYQQRLFLLDVQAHPHDVLTQPHKLDVMGKCRANGWVTESQNGTWSITAKGAQSLTVDA
jgi:hypothetical protein